MAKYVHDNHGMNQLSIDNRRTSQNNEENLWKHYLYELQLQAPTPKRVVCQREVVSRPPHYGREFHGMVSREKADALLAGEEGRYLVRESIRAPSQFTLSLRFGGVTKNFRLYYDGQHFVGEKRFDTIHDLVADGLITLYLESHAADYIASLGSACKYEESPYMTLHKNHRQQKAKNRKTKSHSIKKDKHSHFEAQRINNYDDVQDEVYEDDIDSSVNVQLFEKPHTFKTHNFMGLPWCDFCGNFMWGLLAQGVKCEGN